MTLTVASQFDEAFNDALRALPLRPTVIGVPEDRPWDVATDTDVLLVCPSPLWRERRDMAAPAGWPGRLRWAFIGSAGVDTYPRWLLEAPLVSCARGVASEEIADYVMSAIYHRTKDLNAVRAHKLADWQPASLGRVIGSTVGIIGMGAIGQAVARRAVALGARVVATRRRAMPSPVEGVALLDDPGAVVAEADHLVLALPATPATYHLVDADMLARAKPGSHLINVARGSILDQDALMAALDAGRPGFATLDVTDPEPLPEDHPLWTHPRVRLTPHVSFNYAVTRGLLIEKFTRDLDRFARGEVPEDIVDAVAGY